MSRGVTDGAKMSQFGGTMQALPLEIANHDRQAITGVSVRMAVDNAEMLRVAANTDCYIWWGADDTVVASSISIYFPAGVEVLVVPKGMTHLAAIQESSSGIITITQLGED